MKGNDGSGDISDLQRHQDRVDELPVAEVVRLAEALALEAERLVERDRRRVPREHVKLELCDTDVARPRDRLLEERPPEALPSVRRGDHEPRSATCLLDGCVSRASERRPTIR